MGACPTDEVLAAFARRTLSEAEHDTIAVHLDGCDDCREAIRAATRAAFDPTLAAGEMAPARRPSAPIGPRLGRYDIRRMIGTGGMGQVYEAYDAELDRLVALKVLRRSLAGATRLRERLLRESRLTAKVAHPSVMTVYDVGRDGETVFIAMELIRGETLGAYIERTRPDWRGIVALYERAAQGLAAAHTAGIVHRDFKPDNVLVEADGKRVIVTDFGIAIATGLDDAHDDTPPPDDVRLTVTGAVVGTPAYMAPEQLAGGEVDARADVFAFAVSLWQGVFGARPFVGATIAQIRAAMAHGPKPTRRVPRRLVRALHRGLAVAPADRWPDLGAFAHELHAIRGRRARLQVAAAAVALVGLGTAGAVIARRDAPDPCARHAAAFAAAYDRPVVERALAADPRVQAEVMPLIDRASRDLVATERATCHANREPPQAPDVATCLAVRRSELVGVAADLVLDGPAHAYDMVGFIADPKLCGSPPPALLFASVPDDAATRRKVTALRHELNDLDELRSRGPLAAEERAQAVLAKARGVWPRVEAEALYVVGREQFGAGMFAEAKASLRESAALAESAHADHVAASAWLMLANVMLGSTDPTRALEYLTYVDAALERLGHPPDQQARLDSEKGLALAALGRGKEAEPLLREAVEIVRAHVPNLLPSATLDLAEFFDDQGRPAEAAQVLRDALATSHPSVAERLRLSRRFAIALSEVNADSAEALRLAGDAAALADRESVLPTERAEAHADFAEVLDNAGRRDEALVEVQKAIALRGDERSEGYADAYMLEAEILVDLKRHADAARTYDVACAAFAAMHGDDGADTISCVLDEAMVLATLHRGRELQGKVDRALFALEKAYGAASPQVAKAREVRAALGP